MLLPIGFTNCGYADGIACARDALREHGVCAKSAGTLPPQVRNVTLTDCGHIPTWDDPGAVATVLLEGSAERAGVR